MTDVNRGPLCDAMPTETRVVIPLSFRIRGGARQRHCAAQRALAILVALPATAGTEIVAANGVHRINIRRTTRDSGTACANRGMRDTALRAFASAQRTKGPQHRRPF